MLRDPPLPDDSSLDELARSLAVPLDGRETCRRVHLSTGILRL
jgi:hypothetical protein